MSSNDKKLIVAPFVQDVASTVNVTSDIWEKCRAILIAHYWSGQAAPPSRQATAQLCWTEDALNARFVFEQTEPMVVATAPIRDRKTIGLWERDVCEIFIAPDPNKPSHYFEFEAAPTGEWIDLGIVITPVGKQTDWDFSSGMSTSAHIEKGRVTIGITIPWSEAIPRPDVRTEWRANFFRCAGSHPTERYLAWLPTYTPEPNFHVPEAFGLLRFE